MFVGSPGFVLLYINHVVVGKHLHLVYGGGRDDSLDASAITGHDAQVLFTPSSWLIGGGIAEKEC